jgi:ABC-type antimicrobial peptide transport system permease subunit
VNPIGHHLRVDLLDQPLPAALLKAPNMPDTFEIVGVVGAARNRGLDDAPVPAVFAPYSIFCSPGFFMLVRTQSDPMAIVNDVRRAIKNVNAQQPLIEIHPLGYWLQFATAYPRFATFLFGVFGAVGLLLVGAGVFSVVSYGVAQRTREFGIRMAMGANAGDVVRQVLTGAGRVFAIGMFAGLILSVLLAHELSGRMQGMGNADVGLFLAVPLVLITATLAACVLPARAAILVQPMDALRHE